MATVEGTNRRFSATATTTHPDEVWRLWTSPATWEQWDAGLRSAHLDGPFTAGATGELVDLRGRRSTFVVTQVRPGSTCSYRVPLPGAALVLRRTVDPGSGALRHDVAFTGLLGPVWAAALGRGFRKQIGPTVDALVAAADRS